MKWGVPAPDGAMHRSGHLVSASVGSSWQPWCGSAGTLHATQEHHRSWLEGAGGSGRAGPAAPALAWRGLGLTCVGADKRAMVAAAAPPPFIGFACRSTQALGSDEHQ